MTKFYVDASGNYIGAFDGVKPPAGALEVPTAPDDARQRWNGSGYDPAPGSVLTKVFKADIWRRATEEEAEAIDALLDSQPAKLRRLWSDTTFLSTTDDLFPTIRAGAVQLFGEERANELLEPTE